MNMRVTGSYPAGLTSSVDKRIGDAFPVVNEVHRYLDQLKYLAKNGEKFAGKQVEFRSNSEEKAIEWRYENGEWNVLVSFNELVGININSIEARVELLIETARQAIEQTAHQVATEAADAVSAQFTAVVEAQVASVEALKQETVDAYQAGLAAKVSAEEAAVTAATFAENADVSAAESATSANEAEASANAAELSAQNAAAHKVEAGNQAVAAEASATAATEKLGEVSTLHGAVMAASTTASEAAETTATHLVQITALHSAAETFAQAAQLSAATAAEQAEVAANTVLTKVQNTAQEIEDSITAAQGVWNAKQDTLVSGTNIKTINGESLLGGGDLVVSGSSNGGQDMPIGGITWMHPEFAPDEFTDNAQRFVRTGTAVEFDAQKHTSAVEAGFGLYDSAASYAYEGAVSTYSWSPAMTAVDQVSGVLTAEGGMVAFTPWFNSRGVRKIKFPSYAQPGLINLHSYCWSSFLQTWLVGTATAVSDKTRELSVYRLLNTTWVKVYSKFVDVATANSVYSVYGASSCSNTAIFEFSLEGNRVDLGVVFNNVSDATDVTGSVIYTGNAYETFRAYYGGADGYIRVLREKQLPCPHLARGLFLEDVRRAILTNTAINEYSITNWGTMFGFVSFHEGTWMLFHPSGTNSYQSVIQTSVSGLLNIAQRININNSSNNTTVCFSKWGWVILSSSSPYYSITLSKDGISWTSKYANTTASSILSPVFSGHCITYGTIYNLESTIETTRTATSSYLTFKGLAVNSAGMVITFKEGFIGFKPHTRSEYAFDLVYSATVASTDIYLCKEVNGHIFVYMNSVGLLHTEDGVTWDVLQTGLTGIIHDVAYISGRYVVAGNTAGSKNFAYSSDLTNWTTGFIRTTGASAVRLLNLDDALLALTTAGVAATTDGITFENRANTSFSNTTGRTGVVHEGVIYVSKYSSGSSVEHYVSTDAGATFTRMFPNTQVSGAGSGGFVDVHVRKGKFWALRSDTVYSSTDGYTWVPEPLVEVPKTNQYTQLIEVNGELRLVTNYASWVVLDADSNVPALVGTKKEITQESGAVGFIRIE